MEKFEGHNSPEEQAIEPDANQEIFGQPIEYILGNGEHFDEAGVAVIYKQSDIPPQVGRRVGIYHEGYGAIITKVEQDARRGYKITLQKQESSQ